MKISDLLIHMPEHTVPPEISIDKDLIPTLKPGEATESSLLFIYRRLDGGYSASVADIKLRPYAIVSDDGFEYDGDIPLIRTDNIRKSIAYSFYIKSGFDPRQTTLVGITGTNGKTSTATIVCRVLEGIGIKCGQIGTGILRVGDLELADESYSMTTPDADTLYSTMRKMQKLGCEIIVMEVSSHSIALEKVAPLFFEVAAFTNLSSEHMDFHGDIESYYQTKMRLFTKCKTAIFNIDDSFGIRGYTEAQCDKRSLGIIEQGDIYCTDIDWRKEDGSEFYYHDNKRIFKINTPLLGSFNVYNCAMATSILIELGAPASKIKAEMRSINGIRGRLEIVKREPTVIIDYAHTPLAFENALHFILSIVKPRQKLIVVFGCGGERDKSKRPIMGDAASRYADIIILTEDNSRGEDPQNIINDILSGIEAHDKVTVIPSRSAAIIHALRIAGENDTVAIIGKGHEKYIIDKDGYRSFDEVEIINNYYEDASKDEN